MRYLFLFSLMLSPLFWRGAGGEVFAQFAPPQGQTGSTAMYKDSSAFVAWATSCKITRGLQNISNPSSGYATVGDSTSAVGIADGTVVSLGDSGSAICSFQNEIYDGTGYDFAVFENSFDGNYLELGFVEVSSDGINFFRFPATSNTQDTLQTGAFGNTDATKINNLGGKYITQYGTPFDLSEMQGISGLDINHIKQVRIVDVVGSITIPYATFDKNNNKVNDPWPTPYASCGFDLDAVGVINQRVTGINQLGMMNDEFIIYPNPATDVINLTISRAPSGSFDNTNNIEIYNTIGKCVHRQIIKSSNCQINVSDLSEGVYFLQLKDGGTKKIIISK
ncbi:MAG: T9SS type A sorting domain-containing protein [Bacteroidia bacterium]